MDFDTIENLPREKLLELLSIYAKNWLATDGLWFQGVETHYGFTTALDIDREMWEQFTVIEARRIKAFLELPEHSGLAGLKRALQFRLYAPLNKTETYMEGQSLIYRVVTCRVQDARQRKGLEYHTCKPVGTVEYSLFAAAIDPRITTEVLSCHPDVTDPGCNCKWKFSIP
ncbi:DUF6125 family protein [Breznakiella homolactica]|uniref:Uncharacterized protein n=1 Tax=Breznakiella homolactica TaxID=2798577 RepID=A0A7T8B7E9_9SPIR|nr:DUF6125 family protein [Breznakiella homolactica]QQO07444.1 DUF6125 family protein [Breznakiella homolactica]